MNKPIRKAVLPVAGLGTRFLPATKSIPKEMLTVVDRPILQHVVDEARAAGIEQFIFVTGRNKGVIEDHFDMSYELEDTLKRRGKTKEYEALMADLPEGGRRLVHPPAGPARPRPRRLVRARTRRRRAVRRAAARHGDDGRRARRRAACSNASRPTSKHGGNIIAVEEVPMEETHQYGIVVGRQGLRPSLRDQRHGREAAKGTAPSNLIISGRYILQPEIFAILERSRRAPAAKSSSPTA